MSNYAVQMTYNQIVALADIHSNYEGEDSPRWDGRTIASLYENKELITLPEVRSTRKHETREQRLARFAKAKLTKKGEAYLSMAEYEYKAAEAALFEQEEKRKAA